MRFEEESTAYQAFGGLKQTDSQGRIRLLLGAAIVERGEEEEEEVAAVSTATGAARRDQALLGLIEGEARGA